MLSESDIRGQSTFGMENSEHSNKSYILQIKKASEEIKAAQKSGGDVHLLHVNCEGCEWEMLENLLEEADVLSKVFFKLNTIYQ